MQGSRPQRVADQIREELGSLLARGVKDPGIGFVTITWVKVSPDLQVARVYYTALGDAQSKRNTARALARAMPFLRREIAARLRLRRAPELAFQYDESVERGERIERIFREIHEQEAAAGDTAPGETPPVPDDDDGQRQG